jgi:Molybdopterin oxidoreductase
MGAFFKCIMVGYLNLSNQRSYFKIFDSGKSPKRVLFTWLKKRKKNVLSLKKNKFNFYTACQFVELQTALSEKTPFHVYYTLGAPYINPHTNPELLYTQKIFFYQGYQLGASIAPYTFILPGCSFFERDLWSFSLFGFFQNFFKLVDPPAGARDDIKYLALLCAGLVSVCVGESTNFFDISRNHRAMHSSISKITTVPRSASRAFIHSSQPRYKPVALLGRGLLDSCYGDIFDIDYTLGFSRTLAVLRENLQKQWVL